MPESNSTPYKFRLMFTCDSYDYTNIYLATLNTNKLDYSILEYLFTKKDSDEVISAAYSLLNYSNSISDFDLEELDKINKSFDGD